MIQVKKIWKEIEGEYAWLKASVIITDNDEEKWLKSVCGFDKSMKNRRQPIAKSQGNEFVMWYKVEKRYADSLCFERCDAFVVACLYFAMVAGIDIQSDIPITSRLLYQLNEQLIPIYCNEDSGFKPIRVIAEPASEVEKLYSYVGTGISCGVDSFAAIVDHLRDCVPSDHRVTHLAVFNTGSLNYKGYEHIQSLKLWWEETERQFEYHCNQGKTVAKELGLDFFGVNTNIPDLYQGSFGQSDTYRNNSCILATQKMWSNYYYASTGEGHVYITDLRKLCGFGDISILPNLSLNTLTFYSHGVNWGRLQKIKTIANNPVAIKYLNVCSDGLENCGKCAKCIRTFMNLELLGLLDSFKPAFPEMNFYKKYRWKYLTYMRESTPADRFGYEMRQYAKKIHFKYGWRSDLFHCLLPLRKLRVFIIKTLG